MIYFHASQARRPAAGRRLAIPGAAWAGLVFVAALLPRLYALGSFLTIDEVKWAEGAAQFLLALRSGQLAQTYWHFHPGITITWGSALILGATCLGAPDLAACAQARVADLAGTIGWLRLSPVLLTSAGLAGVYLLGRKLVEERWALLAALLLAFDPFFVAHSRILNGDAGVAILMFLSLLAFLVGVRIQGRPAMADQAVPAVAPAAGFHRPSLLLSGALAGLALLTKLPSPLIGLFIAGLSLVAALLDWSRLGRAAVARWGLILAMWGAVALAVFWLLWPAMWVAPLATLRLMAVDSFNVGEVGAGHATFFMGQVTDDPGPLFYPYVVAFRLTPVVAAGLLLALGWFLAGLRPRRSTAGRQPPDPASTARLTPHAARFTSHVSRLTSPRLVAGLILAYVLFIILTATVSPKKLDRYVMAVIPALVFLAAGGLAKLAQVVRPRYQPPTLDGLVLLQLILAVFAAPYYLTYYNPLLGGVSRAVQQIPVGWGEGLEQAAFYLNSLPGAETLAVSSWYSDSFQPYSAGRRASFSDDGRAQLAADYVVFYVNQVQRQKPDPALVDYFRAEPPVFTVTVDDWGQVSSRTGPAGSGVPWVEVYRAPAAQSASGIPQLAGVAQLLAYRVAGGDNGHQAGGVRVTGDKVTVTLFLRVLGPLPADGQLNASLLPLDPAGGPGRGTWRTVEVKGDWQAAGLVRWSGELALPGDTPAGAYRLGLTLRTSAGRVLAELVTSEKDPAIMLLAPGQAAE